MGRLAHVRCFGQSINPCFASLTVHERRMRRYGAVTKRLNNADVNVMTQQVFQLASQSCVTVSFSYGLGKHDASYTSPQQEIDVLKWMWIANPTGLMVSILARTSIAILLVRLFGVHRWFRWFVIIVTTMATAITIASIPCEFLQATPISGVWDPFDVTATHWDSSITISIMFVTQCTLSFNLQASGPEQ